MLHIIYIMDVDMQYLQINILNTRSANFAVSYICEQLLIFSYILNCI